MHSKPKLNVGISSCLLGEKVRFDGQHKKDESLLRLLSPHVEWVSICPEVESGMSVPREPIRLEKKNRKIAVVTVITGETVTGQLVNYCEKKVLQIKKMALSGFILKKGSPSCGLERVKSYNKDGIPTRNSQGLFAKALVSLFPLLPVEEEGRLKDNQIRENFIERLFAYHRLNQFFSSRWSVGGLVKFHSEHKLQLLAHSPQGYRNLGQLVAKAKGKNRKKIAQHYRTEFMTSLKRKSTKGKNTNSLQHMAGYLSDSLSKPERSELQSVISDFRQGWVPLIVPITLIKHYVSKYRVTYLMGQTYLEPNPRELMLRNHV